MDKYLINCKMHGYTQVTVDDEKSVATKENIFIIVIDKSCDTILYKYYRFINSVLKNRNRVILIGIDDGNESFDTLASLLMLYDAYDIYKVDAKENISANYMLKLEDREPDIAEVQAYIGGDITASADMHNIVFGIENLVNDGDVEALKTFLEEHLISIENFTTTLNKLDKKCKLFNSNELIVKVNALQSNIESLNTIADTKDKKIEEIKYQRDEKSVEVENLKRENEKLKAKNTDLKNSDGGSTSTIIKAYKGINTQLIQCKTKIILYFKEVSYVPYVNTLVRQLMEVLDTNKLTSKLVIYDSSTEMYNKYSPLQIVNGESFFPIKGTLISKTKRFVVSEANTSILEEVIMSDRVFDVVVLYDRIGGIGDLVTGNNVTKFFIINSNKDFEGLKQQLKINDTSFVITHSNSSIGRPNNEQGNFLDIPTIEGYSTSTDAAQTSKYIRLKTAHTQVPLIDTILEKSRIKTLTKK